MTTTSLVPLAGAGAATGGDAAPRAVSEALENLGSAPGLVLVFPTNSASAAAGLAAAQEASGGAPLAGMTADAIITASGPVDGGCAALAFDASIAVGMGVGSDAGADPRKAGRAAASEAFENIRTGDGHPLLLLFVDPVAGDHAEMVAGAYEVTGGSVPFAGGGAGGGEDGTPRAPIASGATHPDAIVAVALRSPRPLGVGVAHGCSPRSVPSIVTRAGEREIFELDGRPAADVYLEKLGHNGEELSDEEFRALAVMHPLAQPELSGDVRLRHIYARASDGGLACVTTVPENAAVAFTEQAPATIVASTAEAVQEACVPLGGAGPRAALVFDCASRRTAVGDCLAESVQGIVDGLDGAPPLAGLYTHGEIGRSRGAKGDRNHALVVVAFG